MKTSALPGSPTSARRARQQLGAGYTVCSGSVALELRDRLCIRIGPASGVLAVASGMPQI